MQFEWWHNCLKWISTCQDDYITIYEMEQTDINNVIMLCP